MDIAEEGSPKYWIVKFPEEQNSIAIVHATWMQNGKCAWPNEKDPRRLQQITMKGLKPQSSWLTYDCTRVFAFDTYDAARRKLAQAEDTSDLCSENELDELSNSSGDEVCTPTPRSLPTPPQRPPTPPRSAFFATSSKGPAHGSGNFSGHTATPGSTYGNDGAFPSQSTSLQMHGMYPQMGPSATKVTTNHQYVPRQGRLYQDLQERRHRRCEVAQQQPASRNVHPSSAACSFSHQSFAAHEIHQVEPLVQVRQLAETPQSGNHYGETQHMPQLSPAEIRHPPSNDELLHQSFASRQDASSAVQEQTPVRRTSHGSDGTHYGFYQEILKLLHTKRLTLQSHTEHLLMVLEKLSSRTDTTEMVQPDIIDEPFKTTEAFLRFEEELKESSEKRNRLKLFMKFVGGATVGERTFRILSRLLSPAVGKEFSLHGTKGKLKFSDLQTWRVLCYSLAPEDQAKVSSKGTLKEIEKATQSWLRHAPESHRRQQARQAAENADSL
ncbi:uncharacterized protein LOC135376828 isoform X2 [Ornithodoros turicata]|uniref:uncharacterized protein LOC135376828 isoform X2 n=1 Tax=Ornithodoros turicata TaxID=34597 RepID=UPI0031390CC5